MDDDLIEELAVAIRGSDLDTIISVAVVIHNYEPTYDLRYFYRDAEYPEPYPIHEM